MLSQEYGCACRWVVDKGQVAQCATHADLQNELDVLRADCTRFLQRITRYEQEIGRPDPRPSEVKPPWHPGIVRAHAPEVVAVAKVAHMDLVMAVANKYPGETRHETAKRYILEREARGGKESCGIVNVEDQG